MAYMKRGIALSCLALLLSGCPPIDDDAEAGDGGIMEMGGADAGSLPEGFADECVCGDDEFVCQATCPEALICAAFTCTVNCTEDDECPDGYTCTALTEHDFENEETTNLDSKYCLGQ